MHRPSKHTRIPDLPFAGTFRGARLVGLHEETRSRRRDLVMDYQELCQTAPPEIYRENGRLFERVSGEFLPRRVRFIGVNSLRWEEVYKDLPALPADHKARTVVGLISWLQGGTSDIFTIMALEEFGFDGLTLSSRECVEEECDGEPRDNTGPVQVTRCWSPPPPLAAGLIPEPRRLHLLYGGDPVVVKLGRRVFQQRLFIGDIASQGEQRPEVDAVLNLSEDPSRWAAHGKQNPTDRWIVRGEGSVGMTPEEISEEAMWVIKRLRNGQRVLVHCSAGFNRSVTTCCAVLILQEGLSAEAALDRVREHHPWARPDQHHWLALKWLALNK